MSTRLYQLVLVTTTFYGCWAHGNQSIQACSSLVASLGEPIVQTFGPEYVSTARGAWNFFNDAFAPSCIVFPRNASHVQKAMQTIYEFDSDYAVQAGGHSAMVGWNNVQNGVLIHFAHMKQITYDSNKDTIALEPGVHWDDAVSTLQAQGVAPVGGREGDVGTGLLLGGGLSFLSPAHGYAADSIKALDVVLVSGQLVTATAHNQFADLFRALKGSGNRFGIVTKYELFPVHTGIKDDKIYFGGTILYPNSTVEAILNATARYVREVEDPRAVLLVVFGASITQASSTRIIIVNLFYNGTELPGHIFGDFLAIPSTSKVLGPLSYIDVASTLPAGADRGNGQLFGASALIGDEKLYLDAHRRWENFTGIFESEMSLSVLAFTPVPKSQVLIGRERGGNAINPPLKNFAYLQIAQQFLPGVNAVSPEFVAGKKLLLEQIPRSEGLPLYINECDAAQNVFETYGDFEELKQVYAKYDPHRFNVRHTSGPIGL